ncbi:uncharacterized protein LOC131227690 [Magnolia sinica]|uniref:uncharacterized protein LOC131227690 n=1 Tax=Magnolia sinica TaxID=86752 RepID=UPI00265864C6|nr:uncharacterized protein LOC131227690 [Magnolia sinica]
MIQITRETTIPASPIPSNPTSMDLKTPKYMQSSPPFTPHHDSPLERNPSFYSKNKEIAFADTFQDPLCKLNLKETADFVKAFPVPCSDGIRRGVSGVGQKRMEAPTTPGRPVFSFNAGNLSRKSFPSKWDDAEKWVMSSSCNESPAHVIKPPEASKISKQNEVFQLKADIFAEKKVPSSVSSFKGSMWLESNSAFHGVSSEVLLKDKFTDNVETIHPNFRYCELTKDGFRFRNSVCETMKDAATEMVAEVRHRDIGTEMTPLASSTTSRCHTPFKTFSPARHNTPASMSGPSVATSNARIHISELQEHHCGKLEPGTQFDSVVLNWSSREEEEEEISKSLRHFEIGGCRKTLDELRASAWEDEEKKDCCIRYQREEAKIQAWVNLQNAKVEAQSKKLEVKIQKMRSKLEEKQMTKMAIVHRRAEEMRAAAHLQHSQHLQRASQQAQKMIDLPNSHSSDHTSCGCFPLQ